MTQDEYFTSVNSVCYIVEERWKRNEFSLSLYKEVGEDKIRFQNNIFFSAKLLSEVPLQVRYTPAQIASYQNQEVSIVKTK